MTDNIDKNADPYYDTRIYCLNRVTKRLKKFNIPILLICGKNILTKNEWSLLGVENIISLSDTGHNHSYCMKNAKQLIEETVESYLKTKDS